MENLRKLFVLRMVLIVALFGGFVATFFVKREKHCPLSWLLHYVAGTGTDKKVPKKVMKEFIDSGSFKTVLEKNYYSNTGIEGPYALTHSLDYEGKGFENRPQLFYLVGCFVFTYNGKKIAGQDVYDWHESEDGRYYTSPLGNNKTLLKIFDIMGRIFGDDLFVTSRTSDNDIITMETAGTVVAISNKLWYELSKVGAKEFRTVIDYDYVLNNNEKDNVVRSRNIESSIIDRFFKIYNDDGFYDNMYYNICYMGSKAYIELTDYDEDEVIRVVWNKKEYLEPSDEDLDIFFKLEACEFDLIEFHKLQLLEIKAVKYIKANGGEFVYKNDYSICIKEGEERRSLHLDEDYELVVRNLHSGRSSRRYSRC